MKTNQKQVAKRLIKKLSALRATLSNDERALLDTMIGAEEVRAHKMTVGRIATKVAPKVASKKVAEVAAHKMTVGRIATKVAPKVASKKVAEVAAHKMTVGRIATKVAPKVASKKAAEVTAHKMATKVAQKAVKKISPRIAFDANSEEYKIVE